LGCFAAAYARSQCACNPSQCRRFLYISRQVIREWLATLNRPRTGLALVDLITNAQSFDAHFAILDETTATTANLLALLPQASGVRVHDGECYFDA